MLAVTLRENALTTLDALKTSLGIDPEEEDAQRDATLVQLINAASAWLETQLGRKLGKSTYRQRYCGTGTQQLSLEQYPIVSVERITDTFTGETITDFDFNETGEIGVLFREDGYNENANESGTITVTLMGTSSSLPYVRSLALKRKEVSVMIVDANDSASVNVAEERCRVIKPPDITRAKEIGSESVSIFVPSLNYR